MLKFKKSIIAILTAAATLQIGFAQVSIGGVSVQNAQNSTETIETKYGMFTVKGGFPVERYESGAVKSFYIEDYDGKVLPQIKMPNFGSGSLYFITPYPKGDFIQNAHPIMFWENGNLKSVYIGNIRYDSLDGDTHLKIKLPNYKHKSGRNKGQMETLSVFPNSVIYFYETGELKSFTVAQGQTLQFLRSMGTTDAQRNKQLFKNQSKIEFYENGSIKSFTPTSSTVLTYKNPLGLMIKKGTKITVSPEDESVLTSFYPVQGSSLLFGKDITVKLSGNMPVVFYDDGKSIKQLSWSFNTINFTLGNVHFYSGVNGENVQHTVDFYEDGNIKTVSGIMTTSFDGEKSLSSYPALVEGKAVNVRQIDYDRAGNMLMADLGNGSLELFSERVKTGIQIIRAWRLYYKDGKKTAAVGNVYLESSSGNFYDTNYDAIILMDGDEITKIIKAGDNEKLSADSKILFDGNGKMTGYTARNPSGTTVETNLK